MRELWALYFSTLASVSLLLVGLPLLRGHCTFFPVNLLIKTAGMLSWLVLVGRGLAWLESRMSRDVDAYDLVDRFHAIHKDVATPLETQDEEEDS